MVPILATYHLLFTAAVEQHYQTVWSRLRPDFLLLFSQWSVLNCWQSLSVREINGRWESSIHSNFSKQMQIDQTLANYENSIINLQTTKNTPCHDGIQTAVPSSHTGEWHTFGCKLQILWCVEVKNFSALTGPMQSVSLLILSLMVSLHKIAIPVNNIMTQLSFRPVQ